MVRFADIVQSKYRTEKSDRPAPVRAEADGFRLGDLPLFEEREKKIPASLCAEESRMSEAATYYKKLLEDARDVRDRVKRNQKIDPFPIHTKIHSIVNSHLVDEMYVYAMSQPASGEMLMDVMEITFASMKVGKGMGYGTQKLIKVGLTAFLGNVGIHKVPSSILRKRERLTKEELKAIRAHPFISYRILDRTGERYRWLAKLALQTHERSDGSGYPRGLKDKQISETASIIGLTETYIAMVNRRPYRDGYRQTDAVRFVIREAKKQFPGKVLKAFINEISLYPLNTLVRLNSKAIGRVQATHRDRPQRPAIALLYDSEGKRIKIPRTVDLSEDPLLYIVEIIDKKDLPQ